MLSGFDIIGDCVFSAKDAFASANSFVRTGEIESHTVEIEFALPYTARIQCARPFNPDSRSMRGLPKNVCDAVLQGYDLLDCSYLAKDRFTGPHTVVRTGHFEFEDGLVIPFTQHIEFGRPA